MRNGLIVCPNKPWHEGKKFIYAAVWMGKLFILPNQEIIESILRSPISDQVVWKEKLCTPCRKELDNVGSTGVPKQGGT